MSKGSKAPAAPDPYATAQAQSNANRETALWNSYLNQVNQYTPYGSLRYREEDNQPAQYNMDAYNSALSAWQNNQSTGGGTANQNPFGRETLGWHDWERMHGSSSSGSNAGAMPQLSDFKNQNALPPRFRSDIEFTPEGQKLFDLYNQQNQSLGEISNTYLDQIRGVAEGPQLQADDAARQRIETALMDRLRPYQERDRESARTQLANQGITMGSEAWRNAQDDLGRKENDARLATVAQAGDEQARLFGMAMAARQQPLNEFNALRNSAQIQNPSFMSQTQGGAQPGNVQGAIQNNYNGALQAWQQGQQNNSNMFGALANLGGSYLGSTAGSAAFASLFSDRRLKENINYVGKRNGHRLYAYNYKGKPGRYIGVMAQEVKKIKPDAVITLNGYLAVNYGMLGLEMQRVA
jgi:hypothetical protein